MVNKRPEQRERTRQVLVATALELFEEQGVAATRTLDVAQAAGVSHGTVFAHFPTREALVEAAVGEFGRAFAERFGARVSADPGVREVLDAHLAAIGEAEGLYERLMREAPLLPPIARGAWVGTQAVVARRLAGVLGRAADAGAIRRADPALLFNTWVGLVHHHLANRDLFCPTGSLVAQRGPALRDHFLALIAP
jgi:AcrR family transcriptional regulator